MGFEHIMTFSHFDQSSTIEAHRLVCSFVGMLLGKKRGLTGFVWDKRPWVRIPKHVCLWKLQKLASPLIVGHESPAWDPVWLGPRRASADVLGEGGQADADGGLPPEDFQQDGVVDVEIVQVRDLSLNWRLPQLDEGNSSSAVLLVISCSETTPGVILPPLGVQINRNCFLLCQLCPHRTSFFWCAG